MIFLRHLPEAVLWNRFPVKTLFRRIADPLWRGSVSSYFRFSGFTESRDRPLSRNINGLSEPACEREARF
jgi:hypothetical protein